MKSHIYIIICSIAVSLCDTINISFENHDPRAKRDVKKAKDIGAVKQETEKEKVTENKNYDIDWTAYKQRWLDYGKEWNAQHARRKSDSRNRDQRDVLKSNTDGVFKTWDAERRNLMRDKQDIINGKPKDSNSTAQDWHAYKQKWDKYGNKWEDYHDKRDGIMEGRTKRDIQEARTDGVSQSLEKERINLLREKQDIIHAKPKGINRTDENWNAYKQRWNEYEKKWEEYHDKRDGNNKNRDKRNVEEVDVDTERFNLMTVKQDIVNKELGKNINWVAYKQKWLQYGKKWNAQHAVRDSERERDKRDTQHLKNGEELRDFDTERINLIRDKLSIRNDKPERNEKTNPDWIAYTQKWEEHENKWDIYHARRDADRVGDRDKRDAGSETAKWGAVGQGWKKYGEQWNEYGKKWEALDNKKKT